MVIAHSYRCGVTEWKTRFVCYTQALNFSIALLFELSLFNLQQGLEWHPRLHPFSVGSAAYEGLALIFNKPRVWLQKDEAYRESSHCPRRRRYIWWGSSVLVVQSTYGYWPRPKPDISYFLLFLVVFSSRFFLTASGVSKAVGREKDIHALPVLEHLPVIFSFWDLLISSHSPAGVRNMMGNKRLTTGKSPFLVPFVHSVGLIGHPRGPREIPRTCGSKFNDCHPEVQSPHRFLQNLYRLLWFLQYFPALCNVKLCICLAASYREGMIPHSLVSFLWGKLLI